MVSWGFRIDRELQSGAAVNKFAPLQPTLLAWYVGSAALTYQLINKGKLNQTSLGGPTLKAQPSTSTRGCFAWVICLLVSCFQHKLSGNVSFIQSYPNQTSVTFTSISASDVFPLHMTGNAVAQIVLIQFSCYLKLCWADMVHCETTWKNTNETSDDLGLWWTGNESIFRKQFRQLTSKSAKYFAVRWQNKTFDEFPMASRKMVGIFLKLYTDQFII